MELTIKKQTEETINVFPPLFFKKQKRYMALLNEEQVITFHSNNDNTYFTYSNGESWLFKQEISTAIAGNENWEEIKEGEFLEAHESFLKSQSLKPVLISNSPNDDLGDVLKPLNY